MGEKTNLVHTATPILKTQSPQPVEAAKIKAPSKELSNSQSSFSSGEPTGEQPGATQNPAERQRAREASKRDKAADVLGLGASGIDQTRRVLDRALDESKAVKGIAELRGAKTAEFIDKALKTGAGQKIANGVTVLNFGANATRSVTNFPTMVNDVGQAFADGKQTSISKAGESLGTQFSSTAWATGSGLKTAELSLKVASKGTGARVATSVFGTGAPGAALQSASTVATVAKNVLPWVAVGVAAGEGTRAVATLLDDQASPGKKIARSVTAVASGVAARAVWVTAAGGVTMNVPVAVSAAAVAAVATGVAVLGRMLEPDR